MWKRYRKRLKTLLEGLRHLQSDKTNLRLLLTLQKELRTSILQVERRILCIKSDIAAGKRSIRTARFAKPQAAELKAVIRDRYDDLEGYQSLLLGLRTIGDGIAHCYFQGHDLRTLAIREHPGFITGKAGAKLEMRTLSGIINAKHAAVLCDITNTLRYADIAVVTGDAPLFLEMKTRKSRTTRDHAQLAKIRHVAEYLHTDKGEGIYGMPGEFRRVTLPFYFDTCAERLNILIGKTYNDPSRFLAEEIEKGL